MDVMVTYQTASNKFLSDRYEVIQVGHLYRKKRVAIESPVIWLV